MEEKNNEIISYINIKVKELEAMSMYISKENVDKLVMTLSNSGEDINAIKTRIDTIFANSIAAYKKSSNKDTYSLEDLIRTYDEIMKLNRTKAKLYLAGGIVPYILLGDGKTRHFRDLNLLCKKEEARIIREVFRNNDLYEPKRDSLTYTINDIDYGFEVVIDGVKVNISIYEESDNGIVEYYFNSTTKVGKIKNINVKKSEYIVPYVSTDNKKYFTKSLELIVTDKILLKREKDKLDIEKIRECNGISIDKIKKMPVPIIKEEHLVGDNLEFTSTMPRIKLDIPKKDKSGGFINFGTVILLIAIIVCLILTINR